MTVSEAKAGSDRNYGSHYRAAGLAENLHHCWQEKRRCRCKRRRGLGAYAMLDDLHVDIDCVCVFGSFHDEAESCRSIFAHQVVDDAIGFQLIIDFDF